MTWITKNYLFSLIANHIIFYPTPIGVSYAWSFGSLAGFSLIIQMISGLLLSMHYIGDTAYAFASIQYIMWDVPNGWLIRYIHSNGASMFFMVVYGHIIRGLYYGSYMSPRQALWCSGVVLFILMMATAFTGYVLPWGQMSFWGATVITSMVTALPVGGKYIAMWIWGGWTVNNPTLHRFYSLHFYLPFMIVALTFIHLALLHRVGSSDCLGSDTGVDDVSFYPLFFTKDHVALQVYIFVFGNYVFMFPNVLNHHDNYVPANYLETPKHVVPEWYFLVFYTMLWSIPHKAAGITTMFAAILILFSIPFTYYSIFWNTSYRPLFKFCFWAFFCDVLLLGWVGDKPIKDFWGFFGQCLTVVYFIFFIICVPFVGRVEEYLFSKNYLSKG